MRALNNLLTCEARGKGRFQVPGVRGGVRDTGHDQEKEGWFGRLAAWYHHTSRREGYMAREYVENRDGGYYVTGSRVSLESVIFLFLDGASPETIVDEFPTLSLEQVYGAITFYLADRAKIDAYLTESEGLWEEARKNQSPIPPALRERLERARRELTSRA